MICVEFRCLLIVGGLIALTVPETSVAQGLPDCQGASGNLSQSLGPQALGLPQMTDDTLAADDTSACCHENYCTRFNHVTNMPAWVYERLTPAVVVGNNKRPHPGWKPAPASVSGAQVTDSFYRHSGFARGHQAASADFKSSRDWMVQTFNLGNAVPQIQNGFNGGVWAQLERLTQNLAASQREIFVVTGPVRVAPDGGRTVIGADQNVCRREIELVGHEGLGKRALCDASDADPEAECVTGVEVPAGLFKVIYVPYDGRAFAFLLSNENHTPLKKRQKSRDYLEDWRISIDVLEAVANLAFFDDLDTRSANVLREQCVATRWR